MSNTPNKKRAADSELSSEPASIKLPCTSHGFNDVIPPPPLTIKNEPFLRLDLLEMTSVPKYWKPVYSLGSGAFGNVQLVHSDCLDPSGQKFIHNEFVIKLVKFPSEKLASVIREIEIHQKCRQHRNIILLGMCYCQRDGGDFRVQMCLEYAALSDLTLLATKYKTEKHVAYICEELLQALKHVHSCGVVHGDVSLKNVLMTHTGIVKLADFGCAHTTEYAQQKDQKFIGGTPGYIAPEVIQMNGFDTKADIWSFASFTLCLMSGSNPFKHGIILDLELYKQLLLEHVDPIIPNNYSVSLKNFLRLTFSYDPSQRMSASFMLTHPFLHNKVTQKEMADHYKEIRRCHGMDLPYPDESEQTFFVPTRKK